MRPNRNGHTSPHTGKHFQYMAALALTLALAAGLIACEESPADPAPALQAAGTTSDEDHPWRAIGRGLLHLADDLGLTAEQQAEIERIRTEVREKNEPLHEQIRSTLGIADDESPRRFAFRDMTAEQRESLRPTFEQIRENHRAATDQVLALLTTEQRATLDSLRAERKARGERRADRAGKRGRLGTPFAGAMLWLPSDLDLTADQRAEIERIRTELREKHEPLREQIQSTLGIPADESPRRFAFREATEEQREALRPIFEQLRADHRAAMEQVTALLTPEQQETLDSLRAERRSRGPGPGGSFRGRRSS